MKLRVLAALAIALAATGAHAGSTEVRASNGSYMVRLTSLKEARFKTTIRQRYDFSCGSAAVATLLTFQYGQPVTETDVFTRMYANGDQAKIREEGFSLLDMRRYFESLGYEADGFELPLDKLAQEDLPAIVLLNERGYRHFVVVKGLRNGRVLIGDPALGTRALSRQRFEKLWDNRVLFVVHNRRELAHFNSSKDWRVAPTAPVELAIQRDGLQNIVMPRRGPGDI